MSFITVQSAFPDVAFTLPGVLDDGLLADWCLRYLGAPLDRVLFRSGFLSEVVGVELSSGLRAVVKARPFQPRNTWRAVPAG